MQASVRVQQAPFDIGVEIDALRAGDARVGAIATFIGTVRDVNDQRGVSTLTLEHYPGMTERALASIVEEAASRFSILGARVVHRIGALAPTDVIVLVAVSSAHRHDALEACGFIIDFLKTRAPLWKKESGSEGERWVEARASDDEATQRWERG